MKKEKRPAPLGVNWGTTNTPEAKRIDPKKKYRTRGGIEVGMLEIKLYNGMGHEVTFPLKGSILRKTKKGRLKPDFNIWTLDGRAGVFGEDINDLTEVPTECLHV